MNAELARSTLDKLMAMDRPIGQIMEIVREKGDGPDKGKLKDCCGTLLQLQFDLMEAIRAAYPEFRQDNA